VAAAVILPRISPGLVRTLDGLRDSKQLTIARRERFARLVEATAIATGFGIVSPAVIDLLGLGAAGRLALERAIRSLETQPDYLLVDAYELPAVECPQEAIIFGDALCLSIAAASVIAKVRRDLMLDQLAERFPDHGFERNRGYGTREHAEALRRCGPTSEHRTSFRPVRAVLDAGDPC
jgi:ribonuclease HII